MVTNRPQPSPQDGSEAATAWLGDPDALTIWLGAAQAPLAVDTEFVRERTYWPKLALVQLGLPSGTALVDPLAYGDGASVGAELAHPGRLVLMHSAGEDLTALRPWLPGPMRTLYDTQIACAFAGLGLGLGYQGAVEQVTGTRLEKQETRSNWLARPLSPSQIRYAIEDVRYLHALHEMLDARLVERGFASWHREDCTRLAEAGFASEPDPQPQLSFRGAWRMPMPAQAQLRRILRWRDEAARTRDLPRRWVLEDDMALVAASDPQHSAARLAAKLAGGPPGRLRSLQPLLNLIERAPDEDEIAATEPIAGPLEGELKATMQRLKPAVEARAQQLDVPAGLLCPRRAMESLAKSGTWPAELAGWRSEVILPELTALL
jgi:ribonuclease D